MFLGTHFISLENVEEWCKRYDLKIVKLPCRKCEKYLKVNIPFFTKEVVGVKADVCECGNKATPFIFIKRDEFLAK